MNPKKKNNTLINKITVGVITGLLVLWIWNHFIGNNSSAPKNSNQEQMKKDKEILEKEKG